MDNTKPVNSIPFLDNDFRKETLDFGSIEDRRKFEQNLIKYGVQTAADVVTIIETRETVTEVGDVIINNINNDAIWELIGHDAWYRKGNVRATRELRVDQRIGAGKAADSDTVLNALGLVRVESDEDDGSVSVELIAGEDTT